VTYVKKTRTQRKRQKENLKKVLSRQYKTANTHQYANAIAGLIVKNYDDVLNAIANHHQAALLKAKCSLSGRIGCTVSTKCPINVCISFLLNQLSAS